MVFHEFPVLDEYGLGGTQVWLRQVIVDKGLDRLEVIHRLLHVFAGLRKQDEAIKRHDHACMA